VIKEHNFEQNTLLSRFRFSTYRNIVEYPFKEPAAKRRKYIPESSYSLAFQGGGVKGAAYVGAYKAIR
jgi:predicted acylesterase/phospholipase RssA